MSKTNLAVPICADGRSVDSRYDPRKEALSLSARVEAANFFVVAGIGAGFFTDALAKRFPGALILAVENSKADIAFLSRLGSFKAMLENKNVFVADIDSAEKDLAALYIPALHGALQIIGSRAWAAENKEGAERLKAALSRAQEKIAADFSTQARFGKIWQRNILLNALYIQKSAGGLPRLPTEKTALIVAAGPSLDASAKEIARRRHEFFVMATDTAYGALSKRKIECDAVVSIDGQSVSRAHFMAASSSQPPIFVFDLCANPSAARKEISAKAKVFFVRSNHPLSSLVARFAEESEGLEISALDPGGGTVTISACDLALKTGFRKIALAGADFACLGGKPYARGTYLDAMFNASSARTASSETAFVRLALRPSATLDSYRASFENWLRQNGFARTAEGLIDEYERIGKPETLGDLACKSSRGTLDMKKFALSFREKFLAEMERFDPLRPGPAATALLPFAAWLLKRDAAPSKNFSPKETLQTAFKNFEVTSDL